MFFRVLIPCLDVRCRHPFPSFDCHRRPACTARRPPFRRCRGAARQTSTTHRPSLSMLGRRSIRRPAVASQTESLPHSPRLTVRQLRNTNRGKTASIAAPAKRIAPPAGHSPPHPNSTTRPMRRALHQQRTYLQAVKLSKHPSAAFALQTRRRNGHPRKHPTHPRSNQTTRRSRGTSCRSRQVVKP